MEAQGEQQMEDALARWGNGIICKISEFAKRVGNRCFEGILRKKLLKSIDFIGKWKELFANFILTKFGRDPFFKMPKFKNCKNLKIHKN